MRKSRSIKLLGIQGEFSEKINFSIYIPYFIFFKFSKGQIHDRSVNRKSQDICISQIQPPKK